jgi:hypothetical protein
MNLVICKYDYYERVYLNLDIVEDDYGNLKINDDDSISEIPFTDILKEKVLRCSPAKIIAVHPKQSKKILHLYCPTPHARIPLMPSHSDVMV